MNNLPRSRQSNIVVQEFEQEILLYDLKTNKAYCLNETSALIWQLCDGTKSIEEISQSLSQKLKIPITEELIWLALDQLKQNGLFESSHKVEINFNGLNRRQMIKKVGLASMIALPVITSVIAPSATMAQSGLLAACASCTTNSQCAYNNCQNNVCSNGMSASAAAGTFLGGAGGIGFCSDPNVGNNTCTTIRGNLCCSGMATADVCNDSAPGPNFGTFSVACRCA